MRCAGLHLEWVIGGTRQGIEYTAGPWAVYPEDLTRKALTELDTLNLQYIIEILRCKYITFAKCHSIKVF